MEKKDKLEIEDWNIEEGIAAGPSEEGVLSTELQDAAVEQETVEKEAAPQTEVSDAANAEAPDIKEAEGMNEEQALQLRIREELARKRASRQQEAASFVLPFAPKTMLLAGGAGLALLCLVVGLALGLQKPSQEEAVIVRESVEVETEAEPETVDPEELAREERLQTVLSSYTNLGIVQCSSYINLRTAPDQRDLTNIIGMLNNGAAVEILEFSAEGQPGWSHIVSGGMEGYISNSYLLQGEEALALVPELIAERATVIADRLRIRTSPEIITGNTIGSAAKGERYEILERVDEDWIRVKTDNYEHVEDAYMSALPENVEISYGLDEARSLDLRQKVLNSYDTLGVSKAADYVNVRKTMDTSSINNIVGKLPGHAGANILSEEDGWYEIQSGKVKGYVKAEYLATEAEAESLAVNNASVMAIVNTDSLNVRSEPSLDGSAWTKIVKDQRYNVINQLDGWVQIDLDTGDDDDSEQGAYVSTRDNNVTVMYALPEAIEYYPAVEAANAAMARRNQIVNYACQFIGNPYVWGGTSLTNGADCSGFVMSVLKHFGISIPRTSRVQAQAGKRVTSSEMKPGDLVFYANKSGTVNHVAMYIGNGQVVNAASRRSGIKISRWNYRTPVAIRNVID